MKLRMLIKNVKSILFPSKCFLCNNMIKQTDPICEICESKLEINQKVIKPPSQLEKLYALYDYRYPLDRLIISFKYNEYPKLAIYLAKQLSDFLQIYDILNKYSIDVICPVPMHIRAIRERGYNQSKLLALNIAKNNKIEYQQLLKSLKDKQTQTKLTIARRAINVTNSVSAINDVKDKNILLVDDVFTTGATLNECARVLKESGAKTIVGLTLAATPRR